MTGIIHTKIKLKEYWYCLYNHVIINRLYDRINFTGSKEELVSILKNYELTYTYLHGGSLINDIEERKRNGEYID